MLYGKIPIMNNTRKEIINTLKDTYNIDLRAQLVKTIQHEEKQTANPSYKIINQIFSYVLKELDWTVVQDTEKWDDTALQIIKESFPKIENTKWFKEQVLIVKNTIKTKRNNIL